MAGLVHSEGAAEISGFCQFLPSFHPELQPGSSTTHSLTQLTSTKSPFVWSALPSPTSSCSSPRPRFSPIWNPLNSSSRRWMPWILGWEPCCQGYSEDQKMHPMLSSHVNPHLLSETTTLETESCWLWSPPSRNGDTGWKEQSSRSSSGLTISTCHTYAQLRD